ncbi:hypothetical protein SPBR_04937 [Sporothrix brasiliensis 5110]|uniref:F-box domain-containing protein n=1 Tax=Sporothrix brasiliensis 5110 TaxID=1398154 RepID=A0A0C2ICS3_9PEZI|nr:uncharacterized protein SPBR_04937 [Sporothrix brasiliensis 5110]KIH87091.1 hypothetical protein SPBR_04937 [Sporothrix brasiliensis 5110]
MKAEILNLFRLFKSKPSKDSPEFGLLGREQGKYLSKTPSVDKLDAASTTWRQRRRQNACNSALHRLPNELLFMIFRESDFLSQQMIRQTCHLFAALITGLGGSRAGQRFDGTYDVRQIWPRHGSAARRKAIRPEWAALTRRDKEGLCTDCMEFELSGQLNERLKWLDLLLWCSSCQTYHKRGMFPASHRRKIKAERSCIGWQGRWRICPHRSLSWGRLVKEWAMCRLVGEWETCTLYGWRGAELSLFACGEGCAVAGGCTNGDNRVPKMDTVNYAYPVDWSEEHERDGPRHSVGTLWRAALFDVDPSKPLSLRSFQEKLDDLGNRNNKRASGPSLCPHVRFNDGKLLRPLQAPHCLCFPRDDNSDNNRTKMDRGPGYPMQQHAYDSDTCQWHCACHGAGQNHASLTRPTKPDGTLWDGCALRDIWGAFDLANQWRSNPNHLHEFQCSVCYVRYSWLRDGNTMVLQHLSWCGPTENPNGTWIRKLDPHSWNITKDNKTKHVYWCPDSTCRTNHEWRALYKRLGV